MGKISSQLATAKVSDFQLPVKAQAQVKVRGAVVVGRLLSSRRGCFFALYSPNEVSFRRRLLMLAQEVEVNKPINNWICWLK